MLGIRPLPFAALLLTVAAASLVTAPARAMESDPTFEAPSPTPPPAPAAAAPAPPDDERNTEPRWYGWQTLLVDGATVGLGFATQSPGIVYAAFLAGGPIVHFAHGNVGKGLGSLALRFLVPGTLGLVGFAVDSANNPCKPGEYLCLSGLGGLVVGAMTGYVVAVAVDAAVLAHDRVPREAPAASTGLVWQPMLGVTRGGATGGVGGVF